MADQPCTLAPACLHPAGHKPPCESSLAGVHPADVAFIQWMMSGQSEPAAVPGRPLLLLDVDGVLNPYRGDHQWLRLWGYRSEALSLPSGIHQVWWKPEHGELLLALVEETGVELAWVTAWGGRANDLLAPRLGLPTLPVVEFDRRSPQWKFPAVLEYAAGRPLAWLDDEFQRCGDRAGFLAARGDAPTLLHDVQPRTGLIRPDLAAVRNWCNHLTSRGDQ